MTNKKEMKEAMHVKQSAYRMAFAELRGEVDRADVMALVHSFVYKMIEQLCSDGKHDIEMITGAVINAVNCATNMALDGAFFDSDSDEDLISAVRSVTGIDIIRADEGGFSFMCNTDNAKKAMKMYEESVDELPCLAGNDIVGICSDLLKCHSLIRG